MRLIICTERRKKVWLQNHFARHRPDSPWLGWSFDIQCCCTITSIFSAVAFTLNKFDLQWLAILYWIDRDRRKEMCVCALCSCRQLMMTNLLVAEKRGEKIKIFLEGKNFSISGKVNYEAPMKSAENRLSAFCWILLFVCLFVCE